MLRTRSSPARLDLLTLDPGPSLPPMEKESFFPFPDFLKEPPTPCLPAPDPEDLHNPFIDLDVSPVRVPLVPGDSYFLRFTGKGGGEGWRPPILRSGLR